MILYLTTILFQVTKTLECALENLKNGKPMPEDRAVTMEQFEKIVDMDYWAFLEKKIG